jgi:hypothetical protein
MAQRCFCGCERSVGFRSRQANAVGERVRDALRFTEGITSTIDLPQLLRPGFIEDGEYWRARLSAITHGHRDPRDIDQRGVADWLREAADVQPEIAAVQLAVAEGGSARNALFVVRLSRWRAESKPRAAQRPD